MFADSRLKIKRSEQHVDELDRMLTDFVRSDFCGFHIEKDPATGQNSVKFAQTRPLPWEVPLVIGDAVHNLRSALDLLACEIVRLAGGTPSRRTAFPIRKFRSDVAAGIEDGGSRLRAPTSWRQFLTT